VPSDRDELARLNVEIGAAETRGDAAFFEKLLAPAFAMRRADGKRIDDRGRFIAAVAKSAERRTEVHSIAFFERDRAIVTCIVTMGTPDGTKRFHNLRLFIRKGPRSAWKLLAWANEPES
jgi:phage terminase large subunit GpA-like protein